MEALRKFRLTAFVLAAALLVSAPAFAQAKNVFMMISDGASFGAWDAADLYTHGKTTSSPYYGPDFKKYLMTTYPLNMSSKPTGGNVPEVSYNPSKAWDDRPVSGESAHSKGYPAGFEGYEYLRQNAVDSASAGTALATGQKTYNSAINWSNDPAGTGAPVSPTIPELAKQSGLAVGTISSVQWSHATPATFSNAHNISRNNYAPIANNMLNGDVMDVIMGAGHPQFNNDGVRQIANYNAVSDANARYVGGRDTWIALNEGTHPEGWKLIQTQPAFEALAKDGLPQGVDPATVRLAGTAEAATTIQQSRSGFAPTDKVDEDPLNKNVPTLVTMTKGAVNVLDAKSKATSDKGFFLQIEGGAVDWAAHANQTVRLIEEQRDFNNTVDFVVKWIETKGGGWDNNLLIITTDHGNSMPLGAQSDTLFMDRITSDDVNGIPTVKWRSGDHTNELVALFARGAGAEMFESLVDGNDPYFANFYQDWALKGFDGRYIDNTDVFYVMKAQVVPTPIPGSILLMGSGILGMVAIGLRRRRA